MDMFELPAGFDADSTVIEWESEGSVLQFTAADAVENAMYLGFDSLDEWAEEMEMRKI